MGNYQRQKLEPLCQRSWRWALGATVLLSVFWASALRAEKLENASKQKAIEDPNLGLRIALPPGFVGETIDETPLNRRFHVSHRQMPVFDLTVFFIDSAEDSAHLLRQAAAQLAMQLAEAQNPGLKSQAVRRQVGELTLKGLVFNKVHDPDSGSLFSVTLLALPIAQGSLSLTLVEPWPLSAAQRREIRSLLSGVELVPLTRAQPATSSKRKKSQQ